MLVEYLIFRGKEVSLRGGVGEWLVKGIVVSDGTVLMNALFSVHEHEPKEHHLHFFIGFLFRYETLKVVNKLVHL